MEIGPVTRPGLSNVGSVSRIVPNTPAPAVGVQFQAVAPAQIAAAPKTQADQKRTPMSDKDSVDRQLKIDPETQQVIYQAIDRSTGEIIRQIPEETLLRLQVYARAMRHADATDGGSVSLSA